MSTNRMKQQAADANLLAGAKANFQPSDKLKFGNGDHTLADIDQAITARQTAGAQTDTDRASLRKSVQSERDVRAQTRKLLRDFIAFVRVTFGEDPKILATFGLEPTKPRTTTPAKKAAAADKAKQTREMRHTMGKRQKADIKAPPAPLPAAPPAKPQS